MLALRVAVLAQRNTDSAHTYERVAIEVAVMRRLTAVATRTLRYTHVRPGFAFGFPQADNLKGY